LRSSNDQLAIGAVVALVALAAFLFRPLDRTLRRESTWMTELEAVQRAEASRQHFAADLHDALEMAPDEDAIAIAIAHVFDEFASTNPAELLLADSSDAHLTSRVVNPAAGAAHCGVGAPFECPAVRRATAQTFATSTALNACPHLRDRTGDARSALCIPVAFMGRSLGVLHMTGPDHQPPTPEQADRMSVLAGQVGTAIGTVRAFSKAQLQANTDSLTGLLNRRSAEDRLMRRLHAGDTFAIVMADLDHFKLLNDTYGHEVGDRSLRLFSDTVRTALRGDDIFARWGGEEFVIALPGIDRHAAAEILDRVRSLLADTCARADTPSVTASFGVSDTTLGAHLDQLLRSADDALLVAKSSGRDRVQLAGAAAATAVEERVFLGAPL
jgi:diguanylate cyclase (GGDEF)-like protein